MGKLFLFFVLLLIVFSACKKDRVSVDVVDLSRPQSDYIYSSIAQLGNTFFIAGGSRWSASSLLLLNADKQLTEISLDVNDQQKALYGVDCLPDGHIAAVGYEGQLYVSDDSGKSWRIQRQIESKPYQDIAWLTTDSVLIVGGISFNKGFSLKSSTWHQPDIQDFDLRNFEIVDIDHAEKDVYYLAGYGAILKSTNRGRQWDFTAAKNDYFKGMAWINALEGVAVGYAGLILQTKDGGDNWEEISDSGLPKNRKCLNVDINIQGDCVIAGEQGFMAFKRAGAFSWRTARPFTNNDLKAVKMVNNQEVLVCGTQGAIYLVQWPE
jgi:photosystem II stability/assembly factor-like uncharacterized protein